jgi:hypothetical protein
MGRHQNNIKLCRTSCAVETKELREYDGDVEVMQLEGDTPEIWLKAFASARESP